MRTVERILAIESGIDYKRIRRPKFLSDDDIITLMRASNNVANLELYFVAGEVFSADDIDNFLQGEIKFDIVFVDYIQQLIEAQGVDWMAGLQTASFKLQDIAKSNNVCMVVLSQVSKEGQRLSAKQKTESFALKGSSTMFQNADVVLMLDRDYDSENETEKKVLRIKLDKARYGSSGIYIDTHFRLETGEILLLEKDRKEVEELWKN